MRLIFLFLAFLSIVHAESPSSNNARCHVIVLPSGSVHQGDYFAFGDSVEISGVINGDAYILANQVIIDGQVNGDVLVTGGSIDISGQVSSNVRALGGQIMVGGQIGRNLTAVSGNVQLLPSANIAGSAVITAGNVDLSSRIGSDATIIASNLRISSLITNHLYAYVGHLRITSKAQINGDIDYRSNSPVWIDPGARIQGGIVRHPSLVNELIEGTWVQGLLVGSKIVGFLMNFIYSLVIGLILIKLFPRNLESALQALRTHPLKSLAYGITLLFLLPLASLILLMTILGVPFALTLIAINIIGFYTAKIYSIFWASNWFFGKMNLRQNRLPTLALGLVVYFALTAIPIFGWIVSVTAMLFGLGAGILAQRRLLTRA